MNEVGHGDSCSIACEPGGDVERNTHLLGLFRVFTSHMVGLLGHGYLLGDNEDSVQTAWRRGLVRCASCIGILWGFLGLNLSVYMYIIKKK